MIQATTNKIGLIYLDNLNGVPYGTDAYLKALITVKIFTVCE